MQKSPIITAVGALLLMTACNNMVLEPQRMGSIALSLSSEIEVDAQTKAGDGSVDCSDFTVSVKGTSLIGNTYSKDYRYGDMDGSEQIPYGTYSISAQNCTEAQALEAQNGLGQVRYAGATTEDIRVKSSDPVPVTIKCPMVNAKASIILDQSFVDDFADIRASLMVGDREVNVPLTDEQPYGDKVMVYFNVPANGAPLVFKVSGKIGENTLTYTNSASEEKLLLCPAQWARITIKSNHNGTINGPGISADESMGENSFTEIIDPEGGTEIIEGGLNLPTILINAAISDATVIDCELDVY